MSDNQVAASLEYHYTTTHQLRVAGDQGELGEQGELDRAKCLTGGLGEGMGMTQES